MSSKTENTTRSDLAMDAVDELTAAEDGLPTGVDVNQYEEQPGVGVYDVKVQTAEAAEKLGKPEGRYITLESDAVMKRNRSVSRSLSRSLSRLLGELLPPEPAAVLVAGLGNDNATPDALGPRVMNLLMVTRHLQSYIPRDLQGKMRSVAGISPGVLGVTGMESEEIIKGILDQISVKTLITVDALAASSIDRLFTTFQLTDTGIHPGAGVGNDRPPINEESLGIPVIAVGIPTVVSAATVAQDTIGMLTERLASAGHQFYQVIEQMTDEERAGLVHEVLSPLVGNMVVTPKEIDIIMREAAQVVARGINSALHPHWDEESIAEYLT